MVRQIPRIKQTIEAMMGVSRTCISIAFINSYLSLAFINSSKTSPKGDRMWDCPVGKSQRCGVKLRNPLREGVKSAIRCRNFVKLRPFCPAFGGNAFLFDAVG